ncbi:hypothetical protein H632_c4663p0, partial [Helicosporidium sp. ATCC 50920]
GAHGRRRWSPPGTGLVTVGAGELAAPAGRGAGARHPGPAAAVRAGAGHAAAGGRVFDGGIPRVRVHGQPGGELAPFPGGADGRGGGGQGVSLRSGAGGLRERPHERLEPSVGLCVRGRSQLPARSYFGALRPRDSGARPGFFRRACRWQARSRAGQPAQLDSILVPPRVAGTVCGRRGQPPPDLRA